MVQTLEQKEAQFHDLSANQNLMQKTGEPHDRMLPVLCHGHNTNSLRVVDCIFYIGDHIRDKWLYLDLGTDSFEGTRSRERL
jgi:hypothetical protein